MKIERKPIGTIYLGDTSVENIFISEYMPDAPDLFVKVYLALSMFAAGTGLAETEDIAGLLGCKTEDVEKGIEYWCKAGILKRRGTDLEIVSLKEQLYGSPKSDKAIPADTTRKLMNDSRIAQMFDEIEQCTKVFIQPGQMQEVLSWLTEYGTNCEVVEAAYKYCAEIGKTGTKYVGTVVKNWAERGLNTKEKIEDYLCEMDRHYSVYRRVMKALGFSRNATEEEKRIMSEWVDELSLDMPEILEACKKTSGISNPNINYVDAVLRNKKKDETKGPARNRVMDYYEKLRNQATQEAHDRRRQVYSAVPKIEEIDNELKDLNLEITRTLMSGGNTDGISAAIDKLTKKREMLLTENNIPIDYMDIRYRCRLCGDTGIAKNGDRCRCYDEVAALASGSTS